MERHILREKISSFHIFFRKLGGANACTPLKTHQRRLCSAACPSLDCPNLTAWFSSRGLLPVTHLFDLSALIVLSCLLITTWQLVKAHGVIRNEPQIHGICYITPYPGNIYLASISLSLVACVSPKGHCQEEQSFFGSSIKMTSV